MERREVEHGIFHFADLELRQTIGVGSFAQVRLVLHKPSQVPYALKVMYKGQVIAPTPTRTRTLTRTLTRTRTPNP